MTRHDADVTLADTLIEWVRRERAGENARGLVALGRPVESLADEVWSVWPDSRRFGREAIAALTADRVPCCRVGLWRHSQVSPLPPLTRGLLRLLGAPCARCTSAIRAELVARVAAGTSPAVRARVNRVAVVASARRNGHATGTCRVCHEYRLGVRAALTAGATFSLPELLPHAPRPASTGRVDIAKPLPQSQRQPPPRAVHDLEGGSQTCNCGPCRARRSARSRKAANANAAKPAWFSYAAYEQHLAKAAR